MSFVPKLNADGSLRVQLEGPDGNPLPTGPSGELQTMINLIADVSGVGNIFGYDNNPSGWVIIGGSPTEGNQVTVTVGPVSKTYTIQNGDTLDDVALGIAALFAADSNHNVNYQTKTYKTIVYFRAIEQGDTHEGETLTATVAIGTGGTLDITATANDSVVQKLFKRILVEVDDQDLRVGRIGVFGEVGTRTRADNPIFLSVRKSLAATAENLFFDKDVTDLTPDPDVDVAFITDLLVADDVASELRIYKGLERDRVENFTGNGTSKDFELGYNAVAVSTHIAVTVGGVPKSMPADFTVEDGPDSTKHVINFKSAPANGAAIVVTYDATQRVLGAFVQASSSQAVQFGAPIKLERDSGHFLIGTVVNKSANAAIVIVNANGFFEIKRGVVG